MHDLSLSPALKSFSIHAGLVQLLPHWNEWKYYCRFIFLLILNNVFQLFKYAAIFTHQHKKIYHIPDISWLVQVQNPHNIKYSGTLQGLTYIWRTEGFRGLFKGNGTNCARIVPNSAVKFFSYEQASKYVWCLYQESMSHSFLGFQYFLKVLLLVFCSSILYYFSTLKILFYFWMHCIALCLSMLYYTSYCLLMLLFYLFDRGILWMYRDKTGNGMSILTIIHIPFPWGV